MRISEAEKGIFPIGVVADIIGVSQKKLRVYETEGIIKPARSEGNHRLYSQRDVELLTFIHYFASVRKVNLAGIKVILELIDLLPKRNRQQLIISVEREIDRLSNLERKLFESQPQTSGGESQPLKPPLHQ